MNKKVYYYKRASGCWVFQDAEFDNDRDAIKHLIAIRKKGALTWRLYLDLPDDYEVIKENFYTKEYWENTTPEKEFEK